MPARILTSIGFTEHAWTLMVWLDADRQDLPGSNSLNENIAASRFAWSRNVARFKIINAAVFGYANCFHGIHSELRVEC